MRLPLSRAAAVVASKYARKQPTSSPSLSRIWRGCWPRGISPLLLGPVTQLGLVHREVNAQLLQERGQHLMHQPCAHEQFVYVDVGVQPVAINA